MFSTDLETIELPFGGKSIRNWYWVCLSVCSSAIETNFPLFIFSKLSTYLEFSWQRGSFKTTCGATGAPNVFSPIFTTAEDDCFASLSKNGNFKPNLVWINKIPKRFLCE